MLFEGWPDAPPSDTFEALLDGIDAGGTARAKQYLDRACTSLDHMLSSIQEVSSYFHGLGNASPSSSTNVVADDVPKAHSDTNRERAASHLLLLSGLLSHTDIEVPWIDQRSAASAKLCIESLAASAKHPSTLARTALEETASAALSESERNLNAFLLTWCPDAVRATRRALVYSVSDDASSRPALGGGPGRFARCLAAYQMVSYASLMVHPFLSVAAPSLIPATLAAISDPCPFAQRCGASLLQHLACGATTASVYWQRDILTHAISRSMEGCEATVWPGALSAAWGLASALDGVDHGVAWRARVAEQALTGARRSGTEAAIRRPLLGVLAEGVDAWPGVVQALGLGLVRYFGTLLPMLLTWAQLEDARGVAMVCEVLDAIMSACWPRMAVHAPVIASVLEGVEARLIRSGGGAASEPLGSCDGVWNGTNVSIDNGKRMHLEASLSHLHGTRHKLRLAAACTERA